MIKSFDDFHFTKNFFQISTVQLRLFDDFNDHLSSKSIILITEWICLEKMMWHILRSRHRLITSYYVQTVNWTVRLQHMRCFEWFRHFGCIVPLYDTIASLDLGLLGDLTIIRFFIFIWYVNRPLCDIHQNSPRSCCQSTLHFLPFMEYFAFRFVMKYETKCQQGMCTLKCANQRRMRAT